MMDQYLLGWILASVLGLAVLYGFVADRTRKERNAVVEERYESVKSVPAVNRELGSDSGDADVIIVGAGVAGSALAYTLGKVSFALSDSCISLGK